MDLKKFAINNIFLLIVGLIFLSIPLNQEDGLTHFLKSQGLCEYSINEHCDEYPGFYHFLGSFFPSNQFMFFNFLLLIYFPYFLFNWLFKSDFAGYFYVTGSSFLVFAFTNNVFPSALTTILFILFVFSNNYKLKLGLLLLSPFVHNSAPMLFFGSFIILELFKQFKGKLFIVFPYLQFNPFNFFEQIFGKIDYWLNSNLFLFSVLGFKEWLLLKRYDLIVLILVSFVFSFNIIRSFFPAQLLLLFGFVLMFERQPIKLKVVFVLLSFVWFALNLYRWVL